MSIILGRLAASVLSSAALIAACGGSSPGTQPSTDLQVAGTYDTAVTLQQSTCTGITVQRFTTSVTHTAGASTLTITHAGNSYTGAVQRNGSFTTTPKAVSGGNETHTLTIAGTFSTTAVNATVTAMSRGRGVRTVSTR